MVLMIQISHAQGSGYLSVNVYYNKNAFVYIINGSLIIIIIAPLESGYVFKFEGKLFETSGKLGSYYIS